MSKGADPEEEMIQIRYTELLYKAKDVVLCLGVDKKRKRKEICCAIKKGILHSLRPTQDEFTESMQFTVRMLDQGRLEHAIIRFMIDGRNDEGSVFFDDKQWGPYLMAIEDRIMELSD